ncbi:hypothetical protein MmTuc01_1949 [Methanosarcina mazei Tuc01]|uniref:Uncharacterized protein n=1 Tax=Methanosarcina mazei Tuc01 TaxID=1236903 RepID=M1Q4M9_METMZ|nr:hypothetical protein MmTuc01_1949 [Methanosarcina mazei Tuc01]
MYALLNFSFLTPFSLLFFTSFSFVFHLFLFCFSLSFSLLFSTFFLFSSLFHFLSTLF